MNNIIEKQIDDWEPIKKAELAAEIMSELDPSRDTILAFINKLDECVAIELVSRLNTKFESET